jgi:hypothetical protein
MISEASCTLDIFRVDEDSFCRGGGESGWRQCERESRRRLTADNSSVSVNSASQVTVVLAHLGAKWPRGYYLRPS